MTKFFKTITHPQGKIDLIAVEHGVGWRVTACQMETGLVFTAYGDTIQEAENAAVNVIRNFDH